MCVCIYDWQKEGVPGRGTGVSQDESPDAAGSLGPNSWWCKSPVYTVEELLLGEKTCLYPCWIYFAFFIVVVELGFFVGFGVFFWFFFFYTMKS